MKLNKTRLLAAFGSLGVAIATCNVSLAQPPEGSPRDGDRAATQEREAKPDGGRREGRPDGDRPEGGPGGPGGGFGGPGAGFGGERPSPEMIAKMMMQRFDKDGDQKLNAEELVAALGEMRPPGGAGGPGGFGGGPGGFGGGPGGTGGPGGFGGGAQFAGRMFEQNDKDGDGKLTGDEIPERMRQGLARIDANGDQSIDRSELEKMMSNFGREGGRPPRDGGQGEGNRTPRRPAAEE